MALSSFVTCLLRSIAMYAGAVPRRVQALHAPIRMATAAAASLPSALEGTRLAPFNPTSADAIELALDLAGLRDGDVLVDIGAGDGRVLVAAARRHAGVCAIGIEYDPAFAARAEARLLGEPEDVRRRCVVHCADATRVPLLAAPPCGRSVVQTATHRVGPLDVPEREEELGTVAENAAGTCRSPATAAATAAAAACRPA
jgi:hypothetical protein